ncbi:MAG: nickel-dependent lactate racemase [Candidatus Bathyarchaeia archaeon]
MVDVWLPYGKTEVCLRVPTRNFLGSVEPKEKPGVSDALKEVERALKEPIGSERLCEIAKPGDKVAIVVDGDTHPAVNNVVVPPILDELKSANVKDENITVVFGWGTRGDAGLNEDILKRIRTVSHDPGASDLVYVGKTRYGTKVFLNRVFAKADLKILTGMICLHSHTGYSGGANALLKVAGEETVKANYAMILHPNARVGVLDGNPIHEDMAEAVRIVKVNFILNVAVNVRGEIVKAFAGDMEKAFHEGVKLVDEMYRVPVDRRADVVVISAGGHPEDATLFQACESIDNVLDVVKRGGVIILIAECLEGYGNPAFHDWMIKFRDLKSIEREIKRNFVWGGHKAYCLIKALQKAQIILVSVMPDYYAVNVFRLKTARTVNEALNQAFKIAGENAKVWAVPYGNHTLPEVKVVGQPDQP